MKQRQTKSKTFGFTIIELLVVISIMAIIATLVIINYNQQRGQRSLGIGQNELVSNIRKTQSFLLSSRDVSKGVAAKAYIVRFDDEGTKYSIQGIGDDLSFAEEVESIDLPTGVFVSDLSLEQNGNKLSVACVQVIFTAPFGKVHLLADGKCNSDAVTTVQDPAALLAIQDSTLVITLQNELNNETKEVTIQGVSGSIIAN